MNFLNLFAVILVTIAEQDTQSNLEFPQGRLDAWVEFMERVPQKFAIHMEDQKGSKTSFYVSQHGLLSVITRKGYHGEFIQNSKYNALVRVNSNGSYALVKVGNKSHSDKVQNVFPGVTVIGNGLFIPDLIAQGHLKLVKVSMVGEATRYDFVPMGGGIPDAFVGVSLEFSSDFAPPFLSELRSIHENKEYLQRSAYSDFRLIDSERLPFILKGATGEINGQKHEVSFKLSYDSEEKFGSERFLLGFYGIEEPSVADFGDNRLAWWIWILISACLVGVLILGFWFIRR